MKAEIDGQIIEGSPSEIVEYTNLLVRQPNITDTKFEIATKEPARAFKPIVQPHAKVTHKFRQAKWKVDVVKHLFAGNEPVTCEAVRKEFGMSKNKWMHGTGFAVRKRIVRDLGWHYDKKKSVFFKPGTIEREHKYMQIRHDKNTKLAKVGRYYRVGHEQAAILAQQEAPIQTVKDSAKEFVQHWTGKFSKDGVHVSNDFFEGLANTLRDKDSSRVRSYLRPWFSETQYTYVFMPFVFLEGRKFCELYNVKGHLVCKNNEICLED